MKINKILIAGAIIILGIIVLVSAGNFVAKDYKPTSSSFVSPAGTKGSTDIAKVTDGVQNIKLVMGSYGYELQPSTLIKGVPVRMEVDMSTVTGCARSIVIPGFNVKKNVRGTDNIIEFTPDKTGTFQIRCSMNMFRGNFDVIEENGQKSAFVEQAAPSTGGCGGSGGCGCGSA